MALCSCSPATNCWRRKPKLDVVHQALRALWRGLAKRALGDAKGAQADIAKGLALDPKVGERYAGYGAQ